jgi:uncharacterized membrane protein (DUF485 family)
VVVREPEVLAGSTSRRPFFVVLTALTLELGLSVALFLTLASKLGISAHTGDPIKFGIFVGIDLAFVLPLVLTVMYTARPATIIASKDGILVQYGRGVPPMASCWDAVALRGRRAYVFRGSWGPPFPIVLTEHQSDRLQAWMRNGLAGTNGDVQPPANVGFSLAAVE